VCLAYVRTGGRARKGGDALRGVGPLLGQVECKEKRERKRITILGCSIDAYE
jgi:hypothetical protein